jgi:hypothetical protein
MVSCRDCSPYPAEVGHWRQNFDNSKEGAPSFAHFAKGGGHSVSTLGRGNISDRCLQIRLTRLWFPTLRKTREGWGTPFSIAETESIRRAHDILRAAAIARSGTESSAAKTCRGYGSQKGLRGTLNLNPVGGWGTNPEFEPTESRYRPKKIRCWRWNR